MVALSAASTDPTGAPRALEKHTLTESAQAGPVQVNPYAAGMGPVGDILHVFLGKDPATCTIVRVFEADHGRRGTMHVLGVECRFDQGPVQQSVGRFHACHKQPAQRRWRPGFVTVDMRPVLQDDLVTRPGLRPQSQLVPHRPARYVQGRFLAQQVGHHRLQTIDRRIIAKNIIPDVGLHHGLEHIRRGTRHGVASHVDQRFGFRGSIHETTPLFQPLT